MHDGPDTGPGGVGLIRARGEIQQLRYGERQEVGEQPNSGVAYANSQHSSLAAYVLQVSQYKLRFWV